MPSTILKDSLIHSGLGTIHEKVVKGKRLTFDDGLALYENSDVLSVGALANIVRERKNGNRAYFICNLHIDYTNICLNGCKFCAFQRQPSEESSYVYSPDEIRQKVKAVPSDSLGEIHMVGGVNPYLPYSYYLDILKAIKSVRPGIPIKAFTMVELAQIARVSKKSLRETLLDLKAAGLDSLPGGGAEIFSSRIHKELFPDKPGADEWLSLQRTAHKAGLRSNATMLYGHIETPAERVVHLMRLRELQDETGGFTAFVPLAFHPHNTKLSHLPQTTGLLDLRNIAVPRLMLDNFPHVKAYWPMLTPQIAQIALHFGADDMDGTVTEEKITHEAGATTPQGLSREELIRLIRETGREPVERDSRYYV